MLTPAQKQYHEIKNQNKDAILFFRLGDFYETFHQDAKICSKILDIALTTKNKNSENPIPMAGIPYHNIEKYIPKLLENNYKIAIAEQVGKVIPGKVVERKITQVITPGTHIKESKNENNILTIISNQGTYFLARSDISTGIFYIQETTNIEELKDILFKISPKEFIIPLNTQNKEEIENYIQTFLNPFITHRNIPYDQDFIIQKYTQTKNFDSFGKAIDNKGKKMALSTFFSYIEELNLNPNITKIKYQEKKENIYLDMLSIKNLELTQSSYNQDKKHSLFAILDETTSSKGSRTLKNRLLNPLKNKELIQFRQEGFEYFKENKEKSEKIKPYLKEIYDIERVFYLIGNNHNSPFNWLKLKISLNAIDKISQIDKKYIKINQKIKDITEKLNEGLKDEGFSLEKDYIKKGFSKKIDELRELAYKGDDLIIQYQQELVKKFNINIRIKYVNNQGFLIEVSKKDTKKFEQLFQNETDPKFTFSRKQTLKIAERYISTYLKEIEEKILSANYELQEKEKNILENWQIELKKLGNDIEEIAYNTANIDIFTNLSKFFEQNNYSKPEFIESGMEIIGGRHPVIEKFLPIDENFIDNDLKIKNDIVHIITGPNMGGKSTFLRQNAIILLLAHCGFLVPAKKCKTKILSGIFARVGSGDVLVKNQSTFMTEMIEVSNILNNADENSFIIFDELGRGTSTYDGMAISNAVIERIIKNLKSKTLFATHYHELTKLESQYKDKIKNFSVAVYDNNNQIIFMKKIVPGGASKSYGIHVAKLAGIPQEIINNSNKILYSLENNKKVIKQNSLFITQDGEYKEKYEDLKSKINNIDINNLTPIEALELLNKLKQDKE